MPRRKIWAMLKKRGKIHAKGHEKKMDMCPEDIHLRESHDSRSTKIYRIRNIIFHTLALLDLRI
jgi:hypothetical protein